VSGNARLGGRAPGLTLANDGQTRGEVTGLESKPSVGLLSKFDDGLLKETTGGAHPTAPWKPLTLETREGRRPGKKIARPERNGEQKTVVHCSLSAAREKTIHSLIPASSIFVW